MNNNSGLLRYRPLVQTALQDFIGRRQAAAGSLPWNREVAERLQVFAGSGKLFRGCLVCFSYALETEAPPTELVLRTAVALELVHTALLIHDDLIDRDDWRRGQPAMHRQYAQSAAGQAATNPEHFGYGMALCAGDMALFWALGLLYSNGLEPITPLFSQVLAEVCAGQMEDIYRGMNAGRPSKRAIYALMRAKTATYSLALPLAAGAILAGRPAKNQQEFYELGLNIGLIFQIRDDELGLFSTTRRLGKPVGTDIREGKKTLAYYYLWQAATAAEKRYFATVFGNPQASATDLAAVQTALRRYQVADHLKQDIDRLQQQAGRQIEQLALNRTAQAQLRGLVRFCAARQT